MPVEFYHSVIHGLGFICKSKYHKFNFLTEHKIRKEYWLDCSPPLYFGFSKHAKKKKKNQKKKKKRKKEREEKRKVKKRKVSPKHEGVRWRPVLSRCYPRVQQSNKNTRK